MSVMDDLIGRDPRTVPHRDGCACIRCRQDQATIEIEKRRAQLHLEARHKELMLALDRGSVAEELRALRSKIERLESEAEERRTVALRMRIINTALALLSSGLLAHLLVW